MIGRKAGEADGKMLDKFANTDGRKFNRKDAESWKEEELLKKTKKGSCAKI